MKDNKKKTEYLLSEIGGIDDKFLNEAQSYRPARRIRIPISAIAACLVVCLTAVIIIAANVGVFDLASGEKSEDVMENRPDDGMQVTEGVLEEPTEKYSELDIIFLSCIDEYQSYSSLDELPAENGRTYVVWQHIESGRIFISRPLASTEVESLDKYFGVGESVGEQSPSLECRVWIMTGEGELMSPYLMESVGNVGDKLFEYEAELIPCEGFIDLIAEILN